MILAISRTSREHTTRPRIGLRGPENRASGVPCRLRLRRVRLVTQLKTEGTVWYLQVQLHWIRVLLPVSRHIV